MALDLHAHKPSIPTISLALRGKALLSSPQFNKGTGFPITERKAFALTGRLPSRVNTLDEQCERAYGQLQQRNSPIRKNSFLQSLKEQNTILYYALLARHLKELVPIIYTPTEAEAIMDYSHLFRRSEGLYLTFPDQDMMEENFLEQTRGREIDLFVCTDSEAILGIGDQGVGGIGISTAKSAIYTLIGGMDPSKSVSVVLDVGTNNKELLNDPLYVGWRENRIRGEDYDKFVDQFVQLVRKYHPHSLLHFEDFGVTNAHRLLDKYRDTHAVFNDDIQGTGAVTLACVMAAIGVASRTRSSPTSTPHRKTTLADQRYVILGAGSAGVGVAAQLRDAIVSADNVPREDATKKFWLVDKDGLLYRGSGEESQQGTREDFFRTEEEWAEIGTDVQEGDSKHQIPFLEVVKRVKPTVLIGCSTAAGAFTEEVVKAMMAGLKEGERPIIFPLSNPSRLVEATPEDLMKWTEGRALVATGSPFDSVKMTVDGKETNFVIAECNNALIYPGLGFGANLSQSRRMTDAMIIAGARRLAALSPAIKAASSIGEDDDYDGAPLLPDFADAPRVNFEVGVAVAEQAVKEGSAQAEWAVKQQESDTQDIRDKAGEKVWVPIYAEYVFSEDGLK